MIVGTAGHIDHGKTTLVRALTGVDTDRLPEEKKRGISIELGYAYLDVPDARDAAAGRIGFVDVPGHERLVHTMLAGATGIDCALLLVAADDGVMPQTREHLSVLALLGIARGAIVITKADRADAARIAQLREDIAALLKRTALADAPVFAVSALDGEGVPDLRAWLFETARTLPSRRCLPAEGFRLAIDRAFTLDGAGTVVTGTIHAGQIAVGDEVELSPAASAPVLARVRSLHAQNRAVTQAQAGQRCAVALAGVDKQQIARGQWLAARGVGLVTQRLDVALTLWQGESASLRAGTPVHVHVGAAEVLGTLALLRAVGDERPLAPGDTVAAQLVLRTPLSAWCGDRVVLRDNAALRTLAGGIVLDPFAPTRYRRSPQRLAELAAWALEDPRQQRAALIDTLPQGLNLSQWKRAHGWRADAHLESGTDLPTDALCVNVNLSDGAQPAWALGAAHVHHATETVVQTLRDFHAREPDALGPEASRLRRLALPRLPEPLWQALLAQWRAQGTVVLRGAFVHLPEHALQLSAADERIAQKIGPAMAEAGFEGCWMRDLARDHGESEALMRTTLARLAQSGELHQVTRDLYYTAASIVELAAMARALAQADDAEGANAGDVSAARFRDATGLGRKRAIQVLEYFDRVGLLRRVGDVHRLRADSRLFMP